MLQLLVLKHLVDSQKPVSEPTVSIQWAVQEGGASGGAARNLCMVFDPITPILIRNPKNPAVQVVIGNLESKQQ